MDVITFVKKLESIKPLKDVYFKNYNELMPDVFEKKYILKEKVFNSLNQVEIGDIIQELVMKYDVVRLSFGDFQFIQPIKTIEKKHIFCYSSGSFLAYSSPFDEVVEYDNDSDDFPIMDYCAKDCESFLAAILQMKELFSLRIQGLVELDDVGTNTKFIRKCADIAGGQKYARFYKGIIF